MAKRVRAITVSIPDGPKRKPFTKKRKQELVEAGKPFWWRKGVSGNPKGGALRPKGFAEAARIFRQIAMSDPVLDEIVKILFDKKNPGLQLRAWAEMLSRGFGMPPQAVFMRMLIDNAEGDAPDVPINDDGSPGKVPGLPMTSGFQINPDDPAQLARATDIAKQLIRLGVISQAVDTDARKVSEDEAAEPASRRNGRQK